MKKHFVLFLLVLAAPLFAQITLEHEYDSSAYSINLTQIDSAESKYIFFTGSKITIFNIDHSLYKKFTIPPTPQQTPSLGLWYVSKNLFDLDNKVDYMVMGNITPNGNNNKFVRVFNEDGETLFSCDSCRLAVSGNDNAQYNGIMNTNSGTKLILTSTSRYVPLKNYVYSLPGKLPTPSKTLGINAPSITVPSSSLPRVYPNPSSDRIRIEYELPENTSSGEILITDAQGNEVKRYKVGSMFNDLLIERSELRSGMYFYKLVTDKGESDMKKLVVTK